MGNSFWKKFHVAIAEAAKSLVSYFDLMLVGFVKTPCDANLMLCSSVLDARMKTCEKTEEGFRIRINVSHFVIRDTFKRACGSKNLKTNETAM